MIRFRAVAFHAKARGTHWTLTLLSLLLWISVASAQHPGAPGSAPAPPSGNGTLTVQIVHPTATSEAAGIAIVLYALSPDGTPGLANGETDAEGSYRFSGISTDPGIVYLIGARYKDIPFGERVTFAAGETQARVEIEILSTTERTTGVAIEELRLRVDWMGDQVVVREILRVQNPGKQVIQLTDNTDNTEKRSIFERPLDPEANDFSSGRNGVDDGIQFEAGTVRFLGPLYPGEQSVQYQYSLPPPGDGRSFKLQIELGLAASRLVVVAGTDGLDVAGPGLIASSPVRSDTDQSLNAWARAGLSAGETLELTLTLPESRHDRALLTVPQSSLWIEVDDTQLSATVDIQIEIPPGAPVTGTLEAPLLRVSIPQGATLQGVAPEAEALGLRPIENGGFDVLGPIGSGTTSLGYSYRMPVARGGIELDMRFPIEVQTLNVLIADTGLALYSSRLHRRRPFRSGTRNYLHREAFNISPDEIVNLELAPIQATGFSRNTAAALTIAAAAAGAFFLFAPLRTATRREAKGDSPLAALQAKREAIYTAIDDLDHDFETAKLEEGDYKEMRDRLRGEAIELLRAERDGTTQTVHASQASAPTPISSATGSGDPRASSDTAGHATTSEFCPSCGGKVISSWRFCSHCGGTLNPPEEASG
jgi:hypothetical protein